MSLPELPGFYYDDAKKKYFKITNGDMNVASAKYHNNFIQAKKRRVHQSQDDSRTATSTPHKKMIQDALFTKYRYSITNIKLGYITPCYSQVLFNSMRSPLSTRVVQLPFSFSVCADLSHKLLTEDENMCIGTITKDSLVNGSIKHEQVLDISKIIRVTSALHTVGMHLIGPKIISVSIKSGFYFVFINATDQTTDSHVNFIQFGEYDGKRFTDRTIKLIKYVSSLPQGKLRAKLDTLLGIEMTDHDDSAYDYDLNRIKKSRYSITSSNIFDRELIIGTNKGEVIRLPFGADLHFRKANYYSYFKSGVVDIISDNNLTYIASKNQIMTFRKSVINNRTSLGSDLRKLIVSSNKHIISVGLKSIRLIKNIDIEPTFVPLAYHNDNIVNQISKVFQDILVVNESNTSIKMYNLKTLDVSTIILNMETEDRLVDIVFHSHTSIFFLYANIERKLKLILYNI